LTAVKIAGAAGPVLWALFIIEGHSVYKNPKVMSILFIYVGAQILKPADDWF
jgi:hypothetical protein